MRVKLQHILQGIEMQSDETCSYLNLNTGEIVYVSQEALSIADEGEYEGLPEWQQAEVKIAFDIIDSIDKYVELPSQFEMNDYKIMERFCYSLSDVKIQDKLLHAIRGKGAFRRFKNIIDQIGLTKQWYEYRDVKYKEIAIAFCKLNSIDYIE
ncbi:UPF0158 family protein [Niallia sp. Krafla_26]|uniref:UPF0158 family protein n=1 Tax=Niallia sp. Krafla_26 TaxID=3064703 RepID=UPI003D170EF2